MGKKIESFEKKIVPNNDVEKIRQILFWQFEYIRRQFLQKHDEFKIVNILSNLQQWQDPKLKDYTIKTVSNAILNSVLFGECSYDLSKIPLELYGAYSYFITLSMRCGYYLNDIVFPYPPLGLIKYIDKYKTTPLPPIPFFGGDRNSSQQIAISNITYYLHGASYHSISPKGDSDLNQKATEVFNKNVNTELMASLYSDEKMDTGTARIFNENWKSIFSETFELNGKTVKQFIKIFQQYTKNFYRMRLEEADRVKSLQIRAVGLHLWDYVNVHKFALEEAISLLRKKCSFSESIAKKETQDFERILNGTTQCVKKGAVLNAEIKNKA